MSDTPIYFSHHTAVIDEGCTIGAGTKIWHFSHIMSNEDYLIVDVDSHHYELESFHEILEYMDDPVLRQLALAGSKPNAKNAPQAPASS